MTLLYSATTGGFYDTDIHGDDVPADAVEITAEERASLLAAQSTGKRIEPDAQGLPCACDPPPLTDDQLASAARNQRDHLLRACDWSALPDVPLDSTSKAAWVSYRQALRNVPEQSGFPATISWPTSPETSA